ncbi:MAG: sigma-70 family RNA polymerase sigma factor, partial [Bacteroidota bacterium]
MALFGSDIKSLEDAELVARYRKTEDSQYLGVLYDRYLHLIYGLCIKYLGSREDSQDAVMGIYEQLTKALLTSEVEHFKSWLYIVAKNFCLMEIRKRKGQDEKNNLLRVEFSPEEHLNSDGLDSDLDALQGCIEELKQEQQLCVTLFYLQKHSYQEVASKSGLSLKTVKSAIQNGKRNLRICVERQRIEKDRRTYRSSQEDFERYLNDEMLSKEAHAFEKATLEDAFEQEALEGWESQDLTDSKEDLARIRAKVSRSTP